ncbi:hypothetical protein QEJ31_04670 [Pigmentibacter sp. JX0631]|uniref:hypothetical protein n=1 Tax=Pigmentibacter sp. JX0631 TaxID=2976982 RepID=UPI0024696846|nr:hypothetical protein [Pigmentibacter sp. JX0631]WGL60890.1 hypothetical protein QEJ31_04670 [Pigmentibacter sp. JX0631]
MTTLERFNFLARKNAPATKVFIFLNISIYIFTCSQNPFNIEKIIQGPGLISLITFGAKENGLIALGEIHRFFFQFFSMQI